jgi:hypothetical protein
MAEENNNLLNLLKELGNQIPRISTDFITPEGIDWKKLGRTIKNASFNNILPMCSTATDLLSRLFVNSNNQKLKDTISWARNSIALYYVFNNIYNNVQPSNCMENRAEIVFWKDIASRFKVEIPICEHYSGACAGQIPIGDILMYLVFKLKIKEKYEFTTPDGDTYDYTVEGAEGNPPTINSSGNIIITSPLCALIRCRKLKQSGGDALVETLYVLKMEKFTTEAADEEGGIGALTSTSDSPSKFIGGQILTEHAAFVIEHPSCDNERCVQACLANIYRGLDPMKYQYRVDASRIYVKPNDPPVDSECWVQSDIMKQISSWCTNAAEQNTSLSYALVGPLGTGKTSTCLHIMNDLTAKGFMIITCKLEDRTLDTVLDRIKFCINMTPKAVILLDELDSLNIKTKNDEANTIIDFFQRVKESKNTTTIVFSTVNNPLNVDESIMTRSGRIDETIEVGYPDETLMTSIFKNYCDKQGYTIDDELSAYTVTALVKAEMSAADVENFCRQIYIKNGKKDGFVKEDLDSVIQSFAKSRDASSKNYYKRQERIEDKKKGLDKA